MKKLIVTCTAVAFATAFIGCGGEAIETPTGDDPPTEDLTGEEVGAGEEEGEAVE